MPNIKNYQKQLVKYLKVKKSLRLTLIFISVFIALILISFIGYSFTFNNRAYAGLLFAKENLSYKNNVDSASLIKEKSEAFLKQTITIDAPDKQYEIAMAEIALTYNIDESAKKAVGLYHGNTFSDYWNRAKILFVHQPLVPVYTYNDTAVNDKVKLIASELDQPEKDYNLKVTQGKVEITTERSPGKRFNREKFRQQFIDQLEKLIADKIQIEINQTEPTVTLENAQKAQLQAQAIIDGGHLTLANSDKTYQIDLDTLSNWLTATPSGEDLVVDLDRQKLKDFLKIVALSIDIGPQDAMLKIADGKVVIATASRDGSTVDIDATAAKIAANLLSRFQVGSSKESSLQIVVKITKPNITAETLASLGLSSLIGSGTTSFNKSPSNRISNITLGAKLLNGLLIKPGETFSTLAHLGEIDASSGFLPELVIKENRTVPEYGGGLCQVSTTLFRAALNSGLKIVERQNHKYRVSYYEPPVGMDATIYDPAPDFKFINDTPGYILIQSSVVGTKITFDFYGTKDGRVVTISTPVVYDVTSPPEPIMEPTDTLPTGEQKQVDHAHDGASASFNYLVNRGDEILEKVTFVSHYVPWPARYLVGTGPVSPAPTPTTSDLSTQVPAEATSTPQQ